MLKVIHKLVKNSPILSLASWCRWSSSLLATAVLPILAAGCAGTFHEVKTLSSGQLPAARPTVLVLGDIQITDTNLTMTDIKVYQLKFQEGVEAWFGKTNTFKSVVAGSTNMTPNSIVLSGTITEVNKGSQAARLFVGMGAGQERIQGAFEIKDAGGQSLIRFTQRKSYLGGLGMGGADFLGMDELTFRYGEAVAESISSWLHGKKLE